MEKKGKINMNKINNTDKFFLSWLLHNNDLSVL